jgi:small nuclear ribonucleoprotein (snRNP)-like protein
MRRRKGGIKLINRNIDDLAKDPRMLSKVLTKQFLEKFEQRMKMKNHDTESIPSHEACKENTVKHKDEKKEEEYNELKNLKYLKELKHLKDLKNSLKDKKNHCFCVVSKKYEGKDVSIRTKSGDSIMGVIKEVDDHSGIVTFLQPSTNSPYEPEVITIIHCNDIESITFY